MGRNRFWFTYGRKGNNSPKTSVGNINESANTRNVKTKKEVLLEKRIACLMDKYHNNPKIKMDILETLEIFNINRTVAIELKNTQIEKKLFREINSYLNRY